MVEGFIVEGTICVIWLDRRDFEFRPNGHLSLRLGQSHNDRQRTTDSLQDCRYPPVPASNGEWHGEIIAICMPGRRATTAQQILLSAGGVALTIGPHTPTVGWNAAVLFSSGNVRRSPGWHLQPRGLDSSRYSDCGWCSTTRASES